MTAAQAVELALGLVNLVLRLVPEPDRAKARRELAQKFIQQKLDDLDSYARSRKR